MIGYPGMAKAHSFYERNSFKESLVEHIRERIGQSLRECYQVSKDLPPNLHTLVRKLDAIEGNYLLRHSDVTADVAHDWSAS
jgi:hypothetical protein